MLAIERLKDLVNQLSEEEALAILRFFEVIAQNQDADFIDEKKQVLVDDFKQATIGDIDSDNPDLPADEIYPFP